MATVIPPFYTVESPLSEAQFYIAAALSVVSGMAPTVMVLRLAISNTTENTIPSNAIPHFSGLNFNNSQENSNVTGSINIDGPGKKDNSSVNGEVQKLDRSPSSTAAQSMV
uniref:Uncharacterized protein n=1 Tax=Psilocybe cubensis TaxID=181762 RepID=A0A8H8CDU5_PSICU